MNTILKSKHKLESLGFQCVPCGPKSKACFIKGWPEKMFTDDDFAPGANVSVKLINGIIDVDLDCDEAVKLAPYPLPPTQCIWGRSGRPRSHWIYRGHHPQSQSFSCGEMLVEFRTGAHLTLAPGSGHPSGELVQFYEDGLPSEVDPDDLRLRCHVLAITALVARDIWGKGNHHEPALGLAGVFAKAGVSIELAQAAMQGLAKEFSPHAESADLLACVKSTYEGHAAGNPISGIKSLKDAGLSEKAADAIFKWLPPMGVQSTDAASPPAANLAGSPPNWSARLTTVGEFVQRAFPVKHSIIEGLLMSQDAALLYGLPGHAKTFASLEMADAMVRGTQFGSLKVVEKKRVLFVDGEMSGPDLKGQCIKLGISTALQLVASVDLQDHMEEPNITNPGQQAALLKLIEEQGIEVVFFDNLFSLAQIVEFISNDDPGFTSLAAFASRLRNAGVTVIFVHHGTKSGKGAMGATRLLAPMDLVIAIKREGNFVTMHFEKHRSRAQPADIQLMITDDGNTLALVDATAFGMPVAMQRELSVLSALSKGVSSIRNIAIALSLAKEAVHAILKELAAKGEVKKANDSPQASYSITDQGAERLGLQTKG
ncbi:MAG: AAA family ATPase [Terricaulis sp.]